QLHFSLKCCMGCGAELRYEGLSLVSSVTGAGTFANSLMLDPLGSVIWRFVMCADHPLGHVSGPLTEAQLRRLPAVNIEDSARTLNKRITWRLPEQKEIVVPDMETRIAAHLAGLGIGFVPRPLCQTLIDKNELVSCT
ncbi:LysR substrate-binding domain-containing protein, partial [Salmonella enterica]|uniref:LysR substrate-binding domain-containing protein n=1 Tax=Salmonella enterica TaxID=28901 RepID=UPI001F5BC6DF